METSSYQELAFNEACSDFNRYLEAAKFWSERGNMERTEFYLVEADCARTNAYNLRSNIAILMSLTPSFFDEMSKKVIKARRELLCSNSLGRNTHSSHC